MADLEKLAGTIDGIEANVLKALEVGDKVKELDAELQSKFGEFRAEVDAIKADGGKVTKALSDRLEDFERRFGRANQPGGKIEPEMSTEKSFGGQFTDWVEQNRSYVHDRKENRTSSGSARISMKGANLRNHLAAVDLLKSQNLPATDENVRKALLLTDATNFAPVQRFANLMPSQGRRLVMRDILPSRSLGVGNSWEYLEYLGMGADTASSMTSITSVTSVATATTAAAHGLRVGDRVQISGANEAGYNGYFFVVTVPTTATFTYTIDPATDDTATGTIVWRNISTWGGAAHVDENALKPQSKVFPRTVTGAVELIAHIFKVSKQALDDVAGLQSDINSMGFRGLAELEEYKFLYGPIVAGQITGILANLSIQTYTQATTGAVGRLSMVAHGSTMIENVGLMATAVIVNPSDRELIDTSVGLDDHFMLPAGVNGGTPSLWRVPMVSTRSIAPGTMLMGDFQEGAYIVDREAPNVSFADQNNDDFEYNRLSIRFEERIGLAIQRPEAFVKLTLTS